jgi:hypothetical protein
MNGGLLGWLEPAQYGQDFYDQVLAGRSGQVVGPIRSAGAYHLVKIEEKSKEVYRFAVLGYDIVPGKVTMDNLRRQVAELISRVKAGEEVEAVAEALKIGAVRTSQPPITPKTRVIPGLKGEAGVNELVRWALSADPGSQLDRELEFDNALVAAFLVSRADGEFLPLDMVRDRIQARVTNEAKGRYVLEKLKAVQGGTLEKYKDAFGTGGFIAPFQQVTFSNDNIPAIGNEPAVVGTIFGIGAGKTSGPVVGNNGVYVVEVVEVTKPQEANPAQIEAFRARLQNQIKSSWTGLVYQALVELAEVKDYRYRHGF